MPKFTPLSDELKEEFHPSKNLPLTADIASAGSEKEIIWTGKLCGHEYPMTAKRRSAGRNCSLCSGRRLEAGINDLATKNPTVATEWHPTKNGTLKPTDVTESSHKKVWWLGACSHEWEAVIANRTKKINPTGCGICKHKVLLTGFNDLQKLYPDIAADWHPNKNGTLKPTDVIAGSDKTVWWQCKAHGHSWEMKIIARTYAGQGCNICANRVVQVGFNDLATTYPEIAAQWHPTLNGELTPQDITYGSHKRIAWFDDKGHTWYATSGDRVTGYGCMKCFAASSSSKGQKELEEYITSLGVKTEFHNRTIIKPYELDIYVPEKKIAIEYNGVHWHSEKAGKPKDYHYEKWQKTNAAGVQLIQIWEDDWRDHEEIIKSLLAYKLGVTSGSKTYARKTEVIELSKAITEHFLDSNHIQGYASGSYYLGLQDKAAELIAVMVLRKEPGNVLNIIRYATSQQVTGGFTKLLTYAEKQYTPDKIITFSDNTVSDGNLYNFNGFNAEATLKPDYMYVVNGTRQHKFGYRLKRFKNDDTLLYQEGLTETELANLNKLNRIWDAGKIRWVKEL